MRRSAAERPLSNASSIRSRLMTALSYVWRRRVRNAGSANQVLSGTKFLAAEPSSQDLCRFADLWSMP